MKIERSEEEWKELLTPDQFYILRQKGTERPFTGSLLNNKDYGIYSCAACDNDLFISDTKFDSGCGWPSFFETLSKEAVAYHLDRSYGMLRTEVTCGACGGHLGHVFNDGPPPAGKRYCMNSISLKFRAVENNENGK